MENEFKEIKVNCSFCGNEMPCPENMAQIEKHMCYACYEKKKDTINPDDIENEKLYIAIPYTGLWDGAAEFIADMAVKHAFPDLWKNVKKEIPELSKRELAEFMFGQGIFIGIQSLIETMSKDLKFLKDKANSQ